MTITKNRMKKKKERKKDALSVCYMSGVKRREDTWRTQSISNT